MSTSPWHDSYRPELCHLQCAPITSTPPKLLPQGSFMGLAKPLCTISGNFMGVCSSTPIHVCCFKNGRNQCRISVWNAALPCWQKNETRFGTVWQNLLDNLPSVWISEIRICYCMCIIWYHFVKFAWQIWSHSYDVIARPNTLLQRLQERGHGDRSSLWGHRYKACCRQGSGAGKMENSQVIVVLWSKQVV